ncbi:hypothetical protein [Futiania mangrovi]|uniref:DUF4340 domain-containing protein n=1 Tax=Futiania mangrovi TaxID=2959716 RepID=A0A9J6P9K9_9PROT|nr:hypothetical protein [Futiania mangrovii]MCP1336628.1 hypothetical protein [Futiania mangrovii]
MRMRDLLLLSAIAGAACLLALAAPSPVRPALPVEEIEPMLAFPGFGAALDTVARIRIAGPEGAAVLVRGSTRWEVASGEDGAAADGARVAALLGGLAQLRLVEEKTRLPERYGLIAVDDPEDSGRGTRVTVYDIDDRVRADLILGKVRIPPAPGLPGERFVRRPGAAQAWLARGAPDALALPDAWRAAQ